MTSLGSEVLNNVVIHKDPSLLFNEYLQGSGNEKLT